MYIQNKIFMFDKSPQHNTDISKPNKIITPPIVGVPIFLLYDPQVHHFL